MIFAFFTGWALFCAGLGQLLAGNATPRWVAMLCAGLWLVGLALVMEWWDRP